MKLTNDKIFTLGLALLLFLLPWQTRWIFHDVLINGQVWEYGRFSLLGTEIILWALVIWRLVLDKPKWAGFKPALTNSIFGPILALLIFGAISIIWADNKLLALNYERLLLQAILFAWLIVSYLKTLNKEKIFLSVPFIAFLASACLQSLLALYQFFTQTTFACKWLGLSLLDPKLAGTVVIEFADQRWLRAYGAFQHPNILGGFLGLALIICLIALWQNQSLTNQQTNKPITKQLFLIFATGLIFSGLFLSFSRSAWIGTALALAVLLVIILKNRPTDYKPFLIKIIVLLGLFTCFWVLTLPKGLFLTRTQAVGRLERISISERAEAVLQAKKIIKENLLTGVGLGNYTVALQENNQDKTVWQNQPVHNIYLLLLAELGILGLLIFAWLLFTIIKKTRLTYLTPLLIFLIIGFFDHYLLTLPIGLLFLGLSVGLAISSPRHPHGSEDLRT
jgi:O-antigen ligase